MMKLVVVEDRIVSGGGSGDGRVGSMAEEEW